MIQNNGERTPSPIYHEDPFDLLRMKTQISDGFSRQLNFPKRIILVRHGQSLGNVDESAYCNIPDWKIPITQVGITESSDAGLKIKNLIGNEPIFVYCSPYLRTKQTLVHLMEHLKDNLIIIAKEEPRLTEQQFGNFQKTEDMQKYKKERSAFGRFYYRFPQGESGLDVYNRVTLFISTLYREFEKEHFSNINTKETNVIIVTHGLTLRLFLMRWFQFSVQEFENSMNPANGSVVVMYRNDICDQQSYCPTLEESGFSKYYLDEKTLRSLKLRSTLQAKKELLDRVLTPKPMVEVSSSAARFPSSLPSDKRLSYRNKTTSGYLLKENYARLDLEQMFEETRVNDHITEESILQSDDIIIEQIDDINKYIAISDDNNSNNGKK